MECNICCEKLSPLHPLVELGKEPCILAACLECLTQYENDCVETALEWCREVGVKAHDAEVRQAVRVVADNIYQDPTARWN